VTGLVAPSAADAAAPGVSNPLLSAGVDGLIAVWDLGRGVLEDDAFVVSFGWERVGTLALSANLPSSLLSQGARALPLRQAAP